MCNIRMRNIILTGLIIISFQITLNGQNIFNINSNIGLKVITVNGNLYQIDSTYSNIKTNFPDFDTISFGTESRWQEMKILCNFKPDSSYTLVFACCSSTDIVPSWKANFDSLKIWDYEINFDKIQSLLLDKPKITLKLLNGSVNDTIFGWNADYACFPKIIRVTDSPFLYGVPSKCFYWTNISQFEFFKSNKNLYNLKDENGFIEDVFPEENHEKLAYIYFRLFDDGYYTITYDLKLKKAILTSD